MALEDGTVVACHNLEQWGQQLQRGIDTKKLVVVDFTASWCGPCRFISPVLAEMARKMPNVIFLKVDVDELKTVAADWAVEAMPTFVFLKDGNILHRIVGAKKDELQSKIAQLAALTTAPATATT